MMKQCDFCPEKFDDCRTHVLHEDGKLECPKCPFDDMPEDDLFEDDMPDETMPEPEIPEVQDALEDEIDRPDAEEDYDLFDDPSAKESSDESPDDESTEIDSSSRSRCLAKMFCIMCGAWVP